MIAQQQKAFSLIQKNFWIQIILCLLAGIIAAFSMPPTNMTTLMFVGITVLFLIGTVQKTPLRDYTCGFLFGIGYFVTGLWWIGNALLVEGNEYAWVWPLSVIGLPCLLSLFTGLAFSLSGLFRHKGILSYYFAFAILLALSEWTRGYIFTGFPWNLFGYAWSDNLAVLQTLSLGGAYSLTFLTLLWASIPGLLFCSRSRSTLLTVTCGVFVFISLFVYGTLKINNHDIAFHENMTLKIIQPSIPQHEKWEQAYLVRNFFDAINLSKPGAEDQNKNDIAIILWPETAMPASFLESADVISEIRKLLQSYTNKAYLVTGTLRREQTPEGWNYFNSVVVFNQDATVISIYDKTHLVPFGEFIPFQNYIPVTPVAAFQGFQRGHGAEIIHIPDAPPVSAQICYEIIFPGESRNNRDILARWIATVTNDAWYGDSAGPRQHFMHARYRAIEEGVPVARSANTGISGLVDPHGRVLHQTKFMEKVAISTKIPMPLHSPTLFRITRHLLFLVALATGLAILIFRKK